MSRSDYRHASDMAQYHVEYSQFEESPYRVACATLGDATLCSGVLGCLVAIPTVAATVAWPGASLITSVTSLCCCVVAPIAYEQACRPEEPTHPDVAARQLRECSGG